ncbi:hypothetical protein A4A49_17658 [Nicotiana attenuata]|uniref:DUF1985 domain-containing protein n=1 Tax=Nicotiana attenuata TaxID=49451 RepID=A0A314KNY5_NICAT|nr:hypothetical protein A4A49_17658 [Nicotiana attenuata]
MKRKLAFYSTEKILGKGDKVSFPIEIQSGEVKLLEENRHAIYESASKRDDDVRFAEIRTQNSKVRASKKDDGIILRRKKHALVKTSVPAPKRRKVGDNNGGKKLSHGDLEYWDFYLPASEAYKTKPTHNTNVNIVDELKENLTPRQLDMFQKTCFGHFFGLPKMLVQNQLIHALLLREVYQPNQDEIWIVVNGVKLRFGLQEFALISGLKCTGDEKKHYNSEYKKNLIDTYFSGESLVNKASISVCFKENMWMTDEDAVKISILGEFNSYPWGKVLFQSTINGLTDKLRTKPQSYRLAGFPLAFQCWFYECCPYVNGLIVSKLNLCNIYPTTLEKEMLDLTGLFEEVHHNELTHNLDDDDDFTTPPPKSTKIQPKNSIDKKTNKVDWGVEIKKLFNEQDELKKEVSVGLAKIKKQVKLGQNESKKEITSLKEYLVSTFSDVFKAIESLKMNKEVNTPIKHNIVENANSNDGGTTFDLMTDHQIRVDGIQLSDKKCDEKGGESIGISENLYDGDVKDVSGQHSNGITTVEFSNVDPRFEEVEANEKNAELEFVEQQQLVDVPETQIDPITREVATKITPVNLIRARRPAAVRRSPYLTDFDSGATNREASSKQQIFKGKYPFEVSIKEKVDATILREFTKFVKKGLNTKLNDCGVYVASFAEFFIEGLEIPIDKFDAKGYRNRLGATLWQYGKMKQDAKIASDSES